MSSSTEASEVECMLPFVSQIMMFLQQMELWLRHSILRLVRIHLGPGSDPVLTDISVLYSSPNFIVVNKRHDILINWDEPTDQITVQKQLRFLFPEQVDSSLVHEFRFVHRLDFATSGALCIALNKKAAGICSNAFMDRTTEKYYLALLRGHVAESKLTINKSIGKDGRAGYSHRMCTDDKEYCEKPRKAITQLLVLQRGLYDGYPATKALLKPITGRRHQLRLHCMDIGHTIVGDYTYSSRKDIFPYRMFLHSYKLVIPMETETIDVSTPDPLTEFDPRNKWTPVEIVHELNENVFSYFIDR